MNIQILHSWLTEYLDTDASPQKIAECLALSGPSVEKVEKWGKNDWVYDIEVTTNRVDMMSVLGIAREAAAILPQFGFKASLKPLKLSQNALLKIEVSKPFPLTIKTEKGLTNRVMAIVIDNVKLGQSPKWLQERLEAAGIRSLNNIIDITNYVMTEVGHPTHVFDYDRITTNELIFRTAHKGEKLTTLDEKTYELPGGDLVIDDGKGNIVDLPGIMGTANSVVTDETKRIIFFIDNNNPQIMRKTSMTLGIRTVAVTLNEKRVDPDLAETAMLRGIQLYREVCHGEVASKLHDLYTNKPKPQTLKLTLEFINERLGVEVKSAFVKKTLETLGFEVKETKGTNPSYTITVPSSRTHDVTIPEDIVEEIARIYGYYKLPSIIPSGFPAPSPQQDQFYWEHITKMALKNWGYYESYTYSAVSKNLIEVIGGNAEKSLKIRNPLSEEWLYMRESLLPSLLQSLANNQEKENNLKFFEMANVYHPRKDDLPNEVLMLSFAHADSDYLKLKGVIEALANQLGITLDFQPTDTISYLIPGVQAAITLQGKTIGSIGQISSEIQQKFGLIEKAVVAEINYQQLVQHASKNKKYTPIPKFPAVIEQMTFFNDEKVPVTDILKSAKEVSSLVSGFRMVDAFKNKLSFEISYLDPNKNLSDEDVKPIRKQLVQAIEKLGLKLQGEV